jgi:NitT/TauT family transport system permease protein
MTIFGRHIPVGFSMILWFGLWEVIGQSGTVFILPPFTDVLSSMWTLFGLNAFQEGAIITFRSFFFGMAIAIVAGVALGLLIGLVETANRMLGMWVNIFVSAPLSSLVPVIMLLCGLGETTIIVTIVMFAMWIIALDTYAGVRHINPSLLDMAAIFGANKWQSLVKIVFWAALPEILAGVRLGLVRAVKGVIIGQLLIAVVAFGQMFTIYSRNFNFEMFWALAIVMFTFAIVLSALIGKLEAKVAYYAGTRT